MIALTVAEQPSTITATAQYHLSFGELISKASLIYLNSSRNHCLHPGARQALSEFLAWPVISWVIDAPELPMTTLKTNYLQMWTLIFLRVDYGNSWNWDTIFSARSFVLSPASSNSTSLYSEQLIILPWIASIFWVRFGAASAISELCWKTFQFWRLRRAVILGHDKISYGFPTI